MTRRHPTLFTLRSGQSGLGFYTTRRDAATAKALLQHLRDRWSIENSWHWPRDTQLREDAHRYRETNGVQILATLAAWP